MGWFSRDPSRIPPADSLLTVQSDLQSHEGALDAVVHGWLDLTEEGLRWRPTRRSEARGHRTFAIGWRQVAGIDGVRIFTDNLAQLQTWLTIDTLGGERIDLTIPRERRDELAEILERFLEHPRGKDPPPPPPPFAIA